MKHHLAGSRLRHAAIAALLTTLGVASAPAGAFAAQQGQHTPRSKWVAPANDHWAGHGLDPTNPAGCDPIDPAQCMLPYPNDWFTKDDPTSRTGRRLDLPQLGMPRNVAGKPIEVQDWNRSDGFSAGAQILTLVPGLTTNKYLAQSGLPPVTNLGLNSQSNLGVILLDAKTGQHVPVWVEVDQYTQESGAVQTGSVQQDLMIHPAVNLTDGHRYIVALRHVYLDDGVSLAKSTAAFAAYRDKTATDARAPHMENIFGALKEAGWTNRHEIYLAWDFTSASTQNVTSRLLSIRDDALGQLGDKIVNGRRVEGGAPAFTVDSTTDFQDTNPKDANYNTNLARQVTGHFTVPCYLFPTCDPPAKCGPVIKTLIGDNIVNDCSTPSQFALDPTNPDAVPSQTPGVTYQANYICNVGRSGFENHQKLRTVEYGHGLFGGAGEVNSDPQQRMAARFGMMYCATDWLGWATADVPNAAIALNDLSRVPLLADRIQQGELNFVFLARVMSNPKGFSTNPAFQYSDPAHAGQSFIATGQSYYDGNSQGGIFGGTVCAVSVDVRHCTLGVPGMDYSILLPRSSDYVAQHNIEQTDVSSVPNDPTGAVGYSEIFDNAYPDQSQRMLIFDLEQTQLDRGDPDGYASHMTHGLKNTPGHQVLLQVAFGDHQVANITAETEARTIGAEGLYPPVVPQRYGPYVDVFWGIPAIKSFPYSGSAITLFDSGPALPNPVTRPSSECGATTTFGNVNGTDWPPTSDTPNRSGEDPHEAPRRALCGQLQKSNFLNVNGVVTNPQPGGAPYFSWGWDGKTGL